MLDSFSIPPKQQKEKPPTHDYLFKALWGGTAMSFHIEAKDEAQAWKRAQRHLMRMEGARTCLDLVLISHT